MKQKILKTPVGTSLLAKRGIVIFAMYCTPQISIALSTVEISNCIMSMDESTRAHLDLCTSHKGCGLALDIHTSCAETKLFLGQLRDLRVVEQARVETQSTIGDPNWQPMRALAGVFDRLKSALLGGKPVTGNQIFEASLTSKQRALEKDDHFWREPSQVLHKSIIEGSEQVLPNNGGYYIGAINSDQKPHGWGVEIWPNGQIVRGQYIDGKQSGLFDYIDAEGVRRLGQGRDHQLNGIGVELRSDGKQLRGVFFENALRNGEVYRADGSIAEKGSFLNGVLNIGQIFNSDGTINVEIDRPGEEARAREVQVNEEKRLERLAEQERVIEQQRKLAALAVEEMTFKHKLETLTVGEMYALADELTLVKNHAKAREVRRVLVSRFPDHPLSTLAAKQLSTGVLAVPSPGATTHINRVDGSMVRNPN